MGHTLFSEQRAHFSQATGNLAFIFDGGMASSQ
jgi:hypothetical protein